MLENMLPMDHLAANGSARTEKVGRNSFNHRTRCFAKIEFQDLRGQVSIEIGSVRIYLDSLIRVPTHLRNAKDVSLSSVELVLAMMLELRSIEFDDAPLKPYEENRQL